MHLGTQSDSLLVLEQILQLSFLLHRSFHLLIQSSSRVGSVHGLSCGSALDFISHVKGVVHILSSPFEWACLDEVFKVILLVPQFL